MAIKGLYFWVVFRGIAAFVFLCAHAFSDAIFINMEDKKHTIVKALISFSELERLKKIEQEFIDLQKEYNKIKNNEPSSEASAGNNKSCLLTFEFYFNFI